MVNRTVYVVTLYSSEDSFQTFTFHFYAAPDEKSDLSNWQNALYCSVFCVCVASSAERPAEIQHRGESPDMNTVTPCVTNMNERTLNAGSSSPQAIMLAVIKKLTYDDEYNFENEVCVFTEDALCKYGEQQVMFFLFVCQGEDEAMFVEYRKQLKMLLDRLAQVSPELLLEAVRRVFTNTMQ